MTTFLRYRTLMLVVFALTAAIGLSGCADTFTGYVDAETTTEEATTLKKAYKSTPQQGRVVPTPSDEMAYPALNETPSQYHGADGPVRSLSPGDSANVPSKPGKPGRRVFVRF